MRWRFDGENNEYVPMDDVGYEEPALKLDSDDDEQVINQGKPILVGKIHADFKRFNPRMVSETLTRAWNLPKPLDTSEVRDNTFIFRFECEGDKMRILNGVPWSVAGHALILREWPSDATLDMISFQEVEFWVQVHGLPPTHMRKKKAPMIAVFFVKLLDVELPDDDSPFWGDFFRMKVRVNVEEPLPTGFITRGHGDTTLRVNFLYDDLHDFCYYCGLLGHVEKDCSKRLEDSTAGRNGRHPTEYGPQLRAVRGSSRKGYVKPRSRGFDTAGNGDGLRGAPSVNKGDGLYGGASTEKNTGGGDRAGDDGMDARGPQSQTRVPHATCPSAVQCADEAKRTMPDIPAATTSNSNPHPNLAPAVVGILTSDCVENVPLSPTPSCVKEKYLLTPGFSGGVCLGKRKALNSPDAKKKVKVQPRSNYVYKKMDTKAQGSKASLQAQVPSAGTGQLLVCDPTLTSVVHSQVPCINPLTHDPVPPSRLGSSSLSIGASSVEGLSPSLSLKKLARQRPSTLSISAPASESSILAYNLQVLVGGLEQTHAK